MINQEAVVSPEDDSTSELVGTGLEAYRQSLLGLGLNCVRRGQHGAVVGSHDESVRDLALVPELEIDRAGPDEWCFWLDVELVERDFHRSPLSFEPAPTAQDQRCHHQQSELSHAALSTSRRRPMGTPIAIVVP